jgi:hypothetical protein
MSNGAGKTWVTLQVQDMGNSLGFVGRFWCRSRSEGSPTGTPPRALMARGAQASEGRHGDVAISVGVEFEEVTSVAQLGRVCLRFEHLAQFRLNWQQIRFLRKTRFKPREAPQPDLPLQIAR